MQKEHFHKNEETHRKLREILKDSSIMLMVMIWATIFAFMVDKASINNGNIFSIYMLAIIFIAFRTEKYIFSVMSSIITVLLINYFFTAPYSAFDFTLKGYPISFLTLFIIAILASVITAKFKKQVNLTLESQRKEKEALEEKQEIIVESEKEKMRGNLLRAISHDLRTPLTAILGSASVIRDSENISEETIKELADGIYNDSNWLIRMVENLLYVTRISGEGKKLKKAEEVVEEIVGEAVGRVKHKYPEADIKIKIPDELLIVPMDSMLIEQVLINLIENSLKYAEDNSRVWVDVWENDGKVYFKVSDRGKGIPESMMKNLFNMGKANQDTRNSRGMGIGLCLCKSIINSHGGNIEAENNEYGGASFTFWLNIEE